MKTIDRYETSDFAVFDNLEDARNHERSLYLQTKGFDETTATAIVDSRDDVLAILKWRGKSGTTPWTPRKRRTKTGDETGDETRADQKPRRRRAKTSQDDNAAAA